MSNLHIERMKWLKEKVGPILEKGGYEIKRISESQSDLGALEGIQFDTERKGGYVYFWSSGYIGYQLVDYILAEEIVSDVTIKVTDEKRLQVRLNSLISEL